MIRDFQFGRVAVIGDLLLDRYVSGDVSRISPEAPVPVLLHGAHRAVAGGAANVAANVAALGAQVRLVGLVGQDEAATELREALLKWPAIVCDGIIADSDWTTITKTRVVSGRQQIVRIDVEKIHPLLEETRARLVAAAEEAVSVSDVIVCSDYAKGVLGDEVLRAVIEAGRRKGIPIVVDPKRRTFEAYRGATLVTPNRQEATEACGLPMKTDAQVVLGAQAISTQFGGDVLITRSEDGMTLWKREGAPTHVAARRSEVFDVSGAGDTVVATIAAVLSAGQDLETAVVMATAAASVSVSRLGTAVVSIDELEQELMQEIPEAGALVSLQEATRIVGAWKRHGAKVVFTNGCFDLLHPGHVSLIRAAAREGDRLVVALNTDRSVSRLKGPSRPVQNEQSRAMVMSALRQVDLVVLFDDDTPIRIIEALSPDVLVKGADYREDQVVGGDFVRANGGRVALVDVIENQSTSRIVKAISGSR